MADIFNLYNKVIYDTRPIYITVIIMYISIEVSICYHI